MKKLIPICLLLSSLKSSAQQPADALRLAWTTPYGTARQQAIGGAMTSLGGDLSAAFTNPAGLAFYRTADAVFTPLYRLQKNKADYLNTNTTASQKNLGMGTSGFVFGNGGDINNKKVRSSAIAFAVNSTANFRENILYQGQNNSSSYSQSFLQQIGTERDANKVAGNFPYGTSLAFNTFWIDTISGGSSGNFSFQSRAANLLPGTLLQRQNIENRGGINEFTLAAGVNLNDKLMLGGSLALPVVYASRLSTFTEADATSNNTNKFYFATLEEDITTKGAGLLARMGIIYKPATYWRLGLSVQTPTVYSLEETASTTVTTDTENYKGLQKQTNADVMGETTPFNYGMITPYRVSGSVSYVLREIQDVTKQRGFITADVEYVNYKASSFFEDTENGSDPDTKAYLRELNQSIDEAYKGAFNFKAGGELKFTTLMVRLGAAYFGNPYKNLQGEKGHRINLSGGLGYRHRGQFIDLTYVHSMGKDVQLPYRLLQGSPTAGINSRVGSIILTYGIKIY